MTVKFLSPILDNYIRSLIVNVQGDPVRSDENWPNYDEVLERFYEELDSPDEPSELESDFLQEIEEQNKGDDNE